MDTYSQGVTPKREYRSLEEKRRIVEETFAEGTSVALVARAHGVNSNLVFHWRKQYRAGRLGGGDGAKLLPVKGQSNCGEFAEVDSSIARTSFLANILGGYDPDPTASCACEHRRKHRSGGVACLVGVSAAMIAPPAHTQIWIAAGVTDLRRGFTGLSALVQTKLEQTPFSGHVFVFRGRRGDLIKVLWFDGDGLCLFSKRLEKGRFTWPHSGDAQGKVVAGGASRLSATLR